MRDVKDNVAQQPVQQYIQQPVPLYLSNIIANGRAHSCGYFRGVLVMKLLPNTRYKSYCLKTNKQQHIISSLRGDALGFFVVGDLNEHQIEYFNSEIGQWVVVGYNMVFHYSRNMLNRLIEKGVSPVYCDEKAAFKVLLDQQLYGKFNSSFWLHEGVILMGEDHLGVSADLATNKSTIFDSCCENILLRTERIKEEVFALLVTEGLVSPQEQQDF